ncbi:hypothetical protein [Bacillus testis]|uniref:hypothetical protein n=1 Tax=Bacillus testis TaxID=1622072 RepID=UPI00067E93DD|nr:hypothetical protein [Bacillus testis]
MKPFYPGNNLFYNRQSMAVPYQPNDWAQAAMADYRIMPTAGPVPSAMVAPAMPNNLNQGWQMPWQQPTADLPNSCSEPYGQAPTRKDEDLFIHKKQKRMDGNSVGPAGYHRLPQSTVTHPTLLDVRQVSRNEIELDFDVPVDHEAALNVHNYWIRSNQNQTDGVATLSRNDKVLLPKNSLTPNMARIEALDDSDTKFSIIFKRNMTPGVQYTVLPSNIGLKGQTDYRGPNWSPESENEFLAQ